MRDAPEFDHIDGLDDPIMPQPDFVWQSHDGSEQTIRAWVSASRKGVSVTLQTVTCGYSTTVETQSVEPEAAFRIARLIADAALDALVQRQQHVGLH